jgi:glycosyltransferase involved in cell wall biosynthesis
MIDLAAQRLLLTGYSSAEVTRAQELTDSAARVSVVVPCFNYGRFLPACVSSVLGQQGVLVDMLIVDDASTDGSGQVADSLARSDHRVRVHHNATNRGHIASYNIGFSDVDGDYVLLLSADDLLTPGALRRAVALLQARPSVGFAYGWSIPFSGSELPPARTDTRSWSVWHGIDWVADRCRRGCNVVRSSDAVVRRTVLERVGGYREDLPHSGDFEWWMRAALVSDVGMVCGADQIYYRLHGSNMSRTTYATTLINLHETRRAFDVALAGNEVDRARLRRLAYRALARKAVDLAVAEYMSGEQDETGVEEYRRFALAADPDVVDSREWRALARRQSLGTLRARRSPLFKSRELIRFLEHRAIAHRWRFSGI